MTPGTVIESALLPEQRNNYLCALYVSELEYGVCFADLSTAQVFATVIDGARMDEELLGELGTYAPREVILNVSARRCAKAADWLKSQGVMLSDNQAF